MSKIKKKVTAWMLILAMTITVCPPGKLADVGAADTVKPYNLSYGRPVYASSQDGGNTAENAVDGDTGTRWQAKQNDTNEWIYVDLGKEADIDHIYLHWEAACAKYYDIQVSNDEDDWTTVYTKGKQVGGYTDLALSYKYTGVRDDGDLKYSIQWTAVEDAVFDVLVDGEIALAAGDNYTFEKKRQNFR